MKTWSKWTKAHTAAAINAVIQNPRMRTVDVIKASGFVGHETTGYAHLVRLVQQGKLHREREVVPGAMGPKYVYYPPINKPNGKVEPQHRVAPPEVPRFVPTADVLIVVPVGSNKTATLTLVEARRVYEQLAAVFKN